MSRPRACKLFTHVTCEYNRCRGREVSRGHADDCPFVDSDNDNESSDGESSSGEEEFVQARKKAPVKAARNIYTVPGAEPVDNTPAAQASKKHTKGTPTQTVKDSCKPPIPLTTCTTSSTLPANDSPECEKPSTVPVKMLSWAKVIAAPDPSKTTPIPPLITVTIDPPSITLTTVTQTTKPGTVAGTPKQTADQPKKQPVAQPKKQPVAQQKKQPVAQSKKKKNRPRK
ncbi:hypothetical protein EV426DRAFT_707529 [Tirmania nivea]|nr:hypothetical protein EV426DRAFT_707529 [Tirmania nivea]